MLLISQAVLEKWGLITAVGPETDQRRFIFGLFCKPCGALGGSFRI